MHYLHAILIRVAGPEFDGDDQAKEPPSPSQFPEARAKARADALEALEYYRGRVFDYLSVEDAGRWSHQYPPELLGAEDRERFLRVFEDFRMSPLQAAKLTYQETVVDIPQLNSGVRSPAPVVDQAFLERAFASDPFVDFDDYDGIAYALNLATGEYLPDSGFFSELDGGTRVKARTLAEVREHPERFALVFLDLHL